MSVSRVREKRMHGLTGGGWKRSPHRPPRQSPTRLNQLKGLPKTLVITEEADVLRDEGEAYASKLRAAGDDVTSVRYQGMIHDILMLNPLSKTNANKAAIAQADAYLYNGLH